MSQNKVIIVAGPTASGKSALAIDIAVAFNGIVINCDSMQVYKHIPIISACPDEHDKAIVEHKLFEIYEPHIKGNVVDWLTLAVDEIKSAWQQNKTAVVVGGTGLYIDNLINGTTPIPETPNKIREKIISEENLFKTKINLYHLERYFNIREIGKIDVLELYNN
jgi:tRNA dimethylallyltransferase